MKKISIVIPVYNESTNILPVFNKITDVFELLPQYRFEIIFVNDGSKDNSQEILNELSRKNEHVKFIEFSRNFGHQLAVKAGIDNAFGDAVITMDGDLQHPPEMLPQLIVEWENGNDIVYTLRNYPQGTKASKRNSSRFFYKTISALSEFEIEEGSADFRLIDASVAMVFRNINEKEPFLRGIAKWVGFTSKAIPYTAAERHSGESKFTLKKMMRLAVTGVTSLSIKPLHFAIYLGFFFAFASLLYIPYVLLAFINKTEISGWASLIMTVVFFGGVQLIMLGIIGIYIGKTFRQTKQMPDYIIKNKNI